MKVTISIAFILLSLGYFRTSGQRTSTPVKPNQNLAQFSVDEYRGCAPLTITITVPECGGTQGCGIYTDINSDSFDPIPLENNGVIIYHLPYVKPGPYKLRVGVQSQKSVIDITILANTPPDFEVYACNNKDTHLDITDTKYHFYEVTYGNDSPSDLPVGIRENNYTFPLLKTYDVKVKGKYNDASNKSCGSTTKKVTVQDLLPKLNIQTLTVESATQIKLDFQPISAAQLSAAYQLKAAANSIIFNSVSTIANIHNQNFFDVANGINANNNYYCFQLTPFDKCTGSPIPGNNSNIICSAKFDVVAKNNENDLTWVTSNPGSFTINRSVGTSILRAASLRNHTDQDIKCGEITYQLISNYVGGFTSRSLRKTVTSFSTDPVPPIKNISSVVNENGAGVELLWPAEDEKKEYSIARAGNLITKSVTENFIDNEYTTAGNYCYQVAFENNCGNVSPGKEACPIRLSGTLESDNAISLSWNAYTGWNAGVTNYIVRRRTGENAYQLYATLPGSTIFFKDVDAAKDFDNQTYQYLITAVGTGVEPSVSNTITVTKEPNIFYPTAFTPNGDKLNNDFKVFGRYVSKFEMSIFNRWGELMFNATDISQGWDGSAKGIQMPEGTYVFIAKITDQEGREFKKSGSVVLLRRK